MKTHQNNTSSRSKEIDRKLLTDGLNLLLDKLSLENLERIYRIVLIWLAHDESQEESQNVEG